MSNAQAISGLAVCSRTARVRPVSSRSKWVTRLILYAQLLMLDMCAILLGFEVASQFNGETWISPTGFNIGLIAAPVYALMAINRNAYTLQVLRDLAESLHRSMITLLMAILVILMFSYFFKAGDALSRLSFIVAVTSSAGFLALFRCGFHRFALIQSNGRLTEELFISDGIVPAKIPCSHVIDAQREGIRPDLNDPEMLSRLAACIRGFDRVIVTCPPERQRAWSLLLKGSNIRGELILPMDDAVGAIGIDSFAATDTLIVSRGPLSLTNRVKKRMLDLIIALPAIVFLGPLLMMVALAIKLEDGGPIFFLQKRIGRANHPFNIIKFRSMRAASCDAHGNRSTERDDDRITRIGRLIRMTSIDELPQLFNVLRGDMSMVGPRPHALGSLAGDQLFWEVNERYWTRHALKPGITGLAQIKGYRGATQQAQDLENRLRADLEYVHSWRLWRDISILFATVRVLVHKNAY